MALLRSDENWPMSGDWMIAKGSPLFTFCPSSALIPMILPVTGEKTWLTLTSANVTRPLVRIVSSTSRRSTVATLMCASLTCSSVSHTWPPGASACFGSSGATGSWWQPERPARTPASTRERKPGQRTRAPHACCARRRFRIGGMLGAAIATSKPPRGQPPWQVARTRSRHAGASRRGGPAGPGHPVTAAA